MTINIDKWDFIRYAINRETEEGGMRNSVHEITRWMDCLKDSDWESVIRDCEDNDLLHEIIAYLKTRNQFSAEQKAEYHKWFESDDEERENDREWADAIKPFVEKRKAKEDEIRVKKRQILRTALLGNKDQS